MNRGTQGFSGSEDSSSPQLDPDGNYFDVDPEIGIEDLEAEIRDLPYENLQPNKTDYGWS